MSSCLGQYRYRACTELTDAVALFHTPRIQISVENLLPVISVLGDRVYVLGPMPKAAARISAFGGGMEWAGQELVIQADEDAKLPETR